MPEIAAGAPVITRRGVQSRRFAVDFPGWDAPNAADFLLPIEAGLSGVVIDVESHGSAPYTRYAVKFTDGTHAAGLFSQDLSTL